MVKMKRVFVSALSVCVLTIAAAAPASATGQIYGNYGGYAPQPYSSPRPYGAPAGPVYGDPYRAGPPVYSYDRGYRSCEGDRVAGTIIGGILGGVIGNNIGGRHRHHGHWGHHGRHGRGGATVAGVLLGGIAGNALGGAACRDRVEYAPQPYAYGNAYAAPGYGYGPQQGYGGPQYDEGYGPEGYGPDDGAYGEEGYNEDYDPDAPYDGR
jgi:hypothetical protein